MIVWRGFRILRPHDSYCNTINTSVYNETLFCKGKGKKLFLVLASFHFHLPSLKKDPGHYRLVSSGLFFFRPWLCPRLISFSGSILTWPWCTQRYKLSDFQFHWVNTYMTLMYTKLQTPTLSSNNTTNSNFEFQQYCPKKTLSYP